MKKLLITTVAALSASSALAADLPSRKAPVVPPASAPLWTGFYAGLNAGYGWGTNNNAGNLSGAGNFTGSYTSRGPVEGVIVGPALSGYAPNTQSGFIGGAQFGYNYQGLMNSNLVIGFETDIQGTGMRGNGRSNGYATGIDGRGFAAAAAGGTVVNGGLDYLGTARGRVGYLVTPAMLLYGTAGLAYGGAYAQVTQSAYQTGPAGTTFTGGGSTNQLLTGWTAGGGVEWMFMPSWSLKGEANYFDLGNLNVPTVAYGASALPSQVNTAVAWGRSQVNYQGVIARVGINYHFNLGAAPVVAAF